MIILLDWMETSHFYIERPVNNLLLLLQKRMLSKRNENKVENIWNAHPMMLVAGMQADNDIVKYWI